MNKIEVYESVTRSYWLPVNPQPSTQQAFGAAWDHQQKKINELQKVLKEIVDISDRKHDAWDKAKMLMRGHDET